MTWNRLLLWITALAAAGFGLRALRDTVRITIEIGSPRPAAAVSVPSTVPAILSPEQVRALPAPRLTAYPLGGVYGAAGARPRAGARAVSLGVGAPHAKPLLGMARLGPVPVGVTPGARPLLRAQSDPGGFVSPAPSCRPEANFAFRLPPSPPRAARHV